MKIPALAQKYNPRRLGNGELYDGSHQSFKIASSVNVVDKFMADKEQSSRFLRPSPLLNDSMSQRDAPKNGHFHSNDATQLQQ